jgi:hypothetical protein
MARLLPIWAWRRLRHRRSSNATVVSARARASDAGATTRPAPSKAGCRTVKLVSAIARGRQWLSEIEAGAATVDGIAAREGCSKRHVNMTISLTFLVPSLVKAPHRRHREVIAPERSS